MLKYRAIEKRSYNQFCSLARALDIIGGRWTLLLIRELISGPKRFKDLLEGLRGIGTNLLAQRLRELEESGLIRSVHLAPPASAQAYELTEVGHGLESAVIELARWGIQFRQRPKEADHWMAGWNALAFKAIFNPVAAAGVEEEYEVRVGDDVVSIRVADGLVDTKAGTAWEPDLTFATDKSTFLGLVSGDIRLREAIESGLVSVTGGKDVLQRFIQIFGSRVPA